MHTDAILDARSPFIDLNNESDTRAATLRVWVRCGQLIFTILISYGLWLVGRSREENAASITIDVVWAMISVFAVSALVRDRLRTATLLRTCMPLLLFTAAMCVSSFWSDQPFMTARRATELVGSTAVGIYFSTRLQLRTFVSCLLLALIAAALFSFALIIFDPSLAIPGSFDGAWAGFFIHKNALGQAMILGLATIICVSDSGGKWRSRLYAFSSVMFLVLLFGSRNGSGTAIAAFMLLFIPAAFIWRNGRHGRQLIIVLAVATVVGGTLIGILLGPEVFLSLLGKDNTLTGRTELWQFVLDAIYQKPLIGYGYGAFWGPDLPASSLVLPYINWVPASAHNGFLEIALDAGVIAEVLLGVLLFSALYRALAFFQERRDRLSAWPLVIVMYSILTNLSGTTFAAYNNFDWIVLVSAYVYSGIENIKNYSERQPSTSQTGTLLD